MTHKETLEKAISKAILGKEGITYPPGAIEKIKQAFQEEGYVQVPQVEMVTKWERGGKPKLLMVNGKEVMTGQEWYDRFCSNMKAGPGSIMSREGEKKMWVEHDTVLEAAKKAAGL